MDCVGEAELDGVIEIVELGVIVEVGVIVFVEVGVNDKEVVGVVLRVGEGDGVDETSSVSNSLATPQVESRVPQRAVDSQTINLILWSMNITKKGKNVTRLPNNMILDVIRNCLLQWMPWFCKVEIQKTMLCLKGYFILLTIPGKPLKRYCKVN